MRNVPFAFVAALLVASCGGGDDVKDRPSSPPAPKQGLIVPQRSIDLVALGMPPDAVRRAYGEPDKATRARTSETGEPIRSEEQLAAKVDGTHCGPANPGTRWCTIGSGRPETPTTVFELRKNRVTRVRVLLAYP